MKGDLQIAEEVDAEVARRLSRFYDRELPQTRDEVRELLDEGFAFVTSLGDGTDCEGPDCGTLCHRGDVECPMRGEREDDRAECELAILRGAINDKGFVAPLKRALAKSLPATPGGEEGAAGWPGPSASLF